MGKAKNPRYEELIGPHKLKKGSEKTRQIASAGGKKSKRPKTIKTILTKFLEQDPEKIMQLSDSDKNVIKGLKTIGCKTVKELVYWKLVQKANAGDMQALKLLGEHVGEDPGKLLKVAGSEDSPPISVDLWHKMSIEELEGKLEEMD